MHLYIINTTRCCFYTSGCFKCARSNWSHFLIPSKRLAHTESRIVVTKVIPYYPMTLAVTKQVGRIECCCLGSEFDGSGYRLHLGACVTWRPVLYTTTLEPLICVGESYDGHEHLEHHPKRTSPHPSHLKKKINKNIVARRTAVRCIGVVTSCWWWGVGVEGNAICHTRPPFSSTFSRYAVRLAPARYNAVGRCVWVRDTLSFPFD